MEAPRGLWRRSPPRLRSAIPAPMRHALLADMKRYEGAGGWYRSPGFWVTATYRFGRWSRALPAAPFGLACRALHLGAALPWRVLRNVSIPAKAVIGPGLYLPHPHDLMIPEGAEIGAGCTLHHDVTLDRGPAPGVPALGDGVTVSPGAKILGGITVGDEVEIGANAVVLRSAPPGVRISAPPVRVIPRELRDLMRRKRGGRA